MWWRWCSIASEKFEVTTSVVVEAGTSETKAETWVAETKTETKTETEAI